MGRRHGEKFVCRRSRHNQGSYVSPSHPMLCRADLWFVVYPHSVQCERIYKNEWLSYKGGCRKWGSLMPASYFAKLLICVAQNWLRNASPDPEDYRNQVLSHDDILQVA